MRVSRGFTLLELLLVLVLIGIGTALGVTSVDRLAGRMQEQRVKDQLQQELRRLRNQAVLGRHSVDAALDLDQGRLLGAATRPGQPRRVLLELPGGYHLAAAPIGTPPVRASNGPGSSGGFIALRFHPDGSMDDARFTLTTPSGSEELFRMTKLTGRIERLTRAGAAG
jgi:general secretion pathway protein H